MVAVSAKSFEVVSSGWAYISVGPKTYLEFKLGKAKDWNFRICTDLLPIFTESAPRLISPHVHLCECVCLCHQPQPGTVSAGDIWPKSLALKLQNFLKVLKHIKLLKKKKELFGNGMFINHVSHMSAPLSAIGLPPPAPPFSVRICQHMDDPHPPLLAKSAFGWSFLFQVIAFVTTCPDRNCK